MKILHVLYQSLPQVSGSSIRSRDLLLSQKEIGLDVLAITTPFQNGINGSDNDIINGIQYIRTTRKTSNSFSDEKKNIFSRVLRLLMIIPFTIKLKRIVLKENPDVIHAHAMFFCGLPAVIIGKLTGKPVIYEFRSLWMYDYMERKKKIISVPLLNKLLFYVELFTMRKADFVFFINNNLKDHVLEKTKAIQNFSVINNAVNTTLIGQLRAKVKTKREDIVFGYIGTLTTYEGIEFLINTFQELHDEGNQFKLVIYGNGVCAEQIKELIDSREDINTIVYKGFVLPDDVFKAYSDISVIINPRLKLEITDKVTPLKPLEAMAYRKIFIGSDVGGINEIITNNYNGFLFNAENKRSLKEVVKKVYSIDEQLKERIINDSLDYVLENRSWLSNAKSYKKIYENLI